MPGASLLLNRQAMEEQKKVTEELMNLYQDRLKKLEEREKELKTKALRESKLMVEATRVELERLVAQIRKTQAQKEAVRDILKALGKEIYVSDESYIDMATAVSGSGPGYIFLIMEALIDAAVHIGLPRELAGELVAQTVMGSAHMTRESGKHPAELKNRVTSPGGTTAEGLLCLEEGGVRAIIAQAVIAAYEKAKLLGGESGK